MLLFLKGVLKHYNTDGDVAKNTVCIVGNDWQVGHVYSRMEYSAEIDHDVQARVGLRVGLKNVNITLTGNTD